MPKLKCGTFIVCGNRKSGYWIADRCKFNNWGVLADPEANNQNFKTREAAERYAWRCHEFKTGRRMSV